MQMHRRKSDAENFLRAPQRKSADVDGIYHADALRAVGDVDGRVEIVEKDADDFAKAECDDGQIVTAQTQRGRA